MILRLVHAQEKFRTACRPPDLGPTVDRALASPQLCHLMCNDYERNVTWAQYRAAMRAAGISIAERQSDLDLPQAADVRIGDMAPIARQSGQVVELAPMRFGMPPTNPRRSPLFNFRSEGRHFANSDRCLVIASAFYEFTGTTYPKTKYRFALHGADVMAIAGIWRGGGGNQPDAFAMLTTAPSADVAPIHNRQVVGLPPEKWRAWLDLTLPEPELLRPLPAGSLRMDVVRRGGEEEPLLI
jgi:putative SOS response-associated peptidase YedK